MNEALLFLYGFSAVTTIYEIVKTSKSVKSNKVMRCAEKLMKRK